MAAMDPTLPGTGGAVEAGQEGEDGRFLPYLYARHGGTASYYFPGKFMAHDERRVIGAVGKGAGNIGAAYASGPHRQQTFIGSRLGIRDGLVAETAVAFQDKCFH